MNTPDFTSMYSNMADACGDKVRCKECGREETVDAANCLRYGWPKCCGFTMGLVNPEAMEHE